MIKVSASRGERITQGDIIRDIDYVESITELDGTISISKISFPLVVVLTQDCDLAQDKTFRESPDKGHDKYLLSVLVAPLYNVEHIYAGDHLSELNMKMSPIKRTGTAADMLRKNQLPRFHFIDFPSEVPIVPSVADFKHYFSVNVGYLNLARANKFVCSIGELYREDLSHRFASFLSRIGLP